MPRAMALGEKFSRPSSWRPKLTSVSVTDWAFFDSHSVYKRVTWHREVTALEAENAQLRAEIERLEAELEQGLSDEEIERIAREQYGMQREGETVYPIKEKD